MPATTLNSKSSTPLRLCCDMCDRQVVGDVVHHSVVLACKSCRSVLLRGDEDEFIEVRGPDFVSQQGDHSRRSYFVVRRPPTVVRLCPDRSDERVDGILWNVSSGLSACVMRCECGVAYGHYLLAAMDALSIQKFCGRVWASVAHVCVLPVGTTEDASIGSNVCVSLTDGGGDADSKNDDHADDLVTARARKARGFLMLHWKCIACEHINEPRERSECRYACEGCGVRRLDVTEEIGRSETDSAVESSVSGQYWGGLDDNDFVFVDLTGLGHGVDTHGDIPK